MPVSFAIHVGSSEPIYRQLADRVRAAILEGDALAGEALPSVRSLAEELLVNPNTIVRAYSELAGEGLVSAQPGRGYFISERKQTLSLAERRRRLKAASTAFAHEIGFLDISTEEAIAAVETALAQQRKDPA